MKRGFYVGEVASICSLEVEVTIASSSEWPFVNSKWLHRFSLGVELAVGCGHFTCGSLF